MSLQSTQYLVLLVLHFHLASHLFVKRMYLFVWFFVSIRSFVETLLLMYAKTFNVIYLMWISFLITSLYTCILYMGNSHEPHAVGLRMTYVFTVHLLHSIDALMVSTNDLLSKYLWFCNARAKLNLLTPVVHIKSDDNFTDFLLKRNWSVRSFIL